MLCQGPAPQEDAGAGALKARCCKKTTTKRTFAFYQVTQSLVVDPLEEMFNSLLV